MNYINLKEENELPEGWFTKEDIEGYRMLMEEIPRNTLIAELGVWKGRSLCSIAGIIKEKNLTVFAVDTFEGTKGEEEAHKEAKVVNIKNIFTSNLGKFGITDCVSIYTGKTDNEKLIEQLQKNKAKFSNVFIDADHSVGAVMRDICIWVHFIEEGGFISGHDANWESVQTALKALDLYNSVRLKGNVWSIKAETAIDLIRKKRVEMEAVVSQNEKRPFYSKEMNRTATDEVTCVICTKDRYTSSLPLTIQAIINQTKKPKYLWIYDDSDTKRDLFGIELYVNLFKQLDLSRIKWSVKQTNCVGQVVNHQHSFENAPTDLIWRVDDDVIPDADCLELLYYTMVKEGLRDIAAVGGIIQTVGIPIYDIKTCGTKIKDIYTKPNIQWSAHNLEFPGQVEVEHLHCSFLYDRRMFDGYNLKLSKVGHREETLFTYQAIKKGYKLLFSPSIRSLHLKQDTGGIRVGTQEMFDADEKVFREELNEIFSSVQEPKESQENGLKFVYLDCGLGDHFAFINSGVKLANGCYVACCYPEVFEELPVNTHSLAEGQEVISKMKMNIEDFNIYKFMWDNNWQDKGTLSEAFKQLYADLYIPKMQAS